MRKVSRQFAIVAMSALLMSGAGATPPDADQSLAPIAPGQHGGQPFWNRDALRFIYPPAFDFAEIKGATSYRFSVVGSDGERLAFTAHRPDADLASVWSKVPKV
jgi:hypothetical protein